ncbi:FMN-binding protein [Jejuia spongiicola]|uniref:FMN-binding protein n=1 Tax=Jejuia spongiicola TaxID=2942207 RepID=A0ABT0QCB2_9FLAO|nr:MULTISPECIES: FMN-binding protein [Flavobacteriaceae]MCL6294590.1 FMN-binding protein [Jejuia spongiicola]PIA78089.1 FMN-binding protein [Gaetbulibacter sp. 4G1]
MNLKQVSLLILALIMMSFGLPKNIQKKVNKEIVKTYGVETFDFTEVIIASDVAKGLPSKFETNNLFKIEANGNLLGYAYLSKAPSKTALFDYLVLLDKDLIVLKSKVLIYREEYGGEIGSKRWLKQFIGKKGGDQLKHGDNIMAISGATISVRSMTNAMNDFLESLRILQSKNIL